MRMALFCGLIASATMLLSAQKLAAQPGGLKDDDAIMPVSVLLCNDMRLHHVLEPNAPVGCDRLKLVKFKFVDFDSILHDDGEIIVMDAAAFHVANIFKELMDKRFPIAKATLMNQYEGSDESTMADNNTSGFNHRVIANGNTISLHAYGLAIDINPIQNPYVKRFGNTFDIQPRAGAAYINRSKQRPGMAEAVVDIFAENGFLIWGGDWKNPIDYQHFQVSRNMAEQLALVTAAEAEKVFNQFIERYRTCRRASQGKPQLARIECIRIADPSSGKGRN